jgi:hypothetical protein
VKKTPPGLLKKFSGELEERFLRNYYKICKVAYV